MKVISKSSSIAGSCITPAPPPENAEKIFEISEIKTDIYNLANYSLRIIVPTPESVKSSNKTE